MQSTHLHRQGWTKFLEGTNEHEGLEDFRTRISFTVVVQTHEILCQLERVIAVKGCTTIH